MTALEWHSKPSDEVLQQLESSATGLTTAEAKKRLAEHGANAIVEKRRRSLLAILLRQFADFMIVVLLLAALISGFIGEPQDTIAILVIVLLNAIIGAVQEYRAERAVAALREMAAPEAHVLRDAQAITLAAAELVPGDVVLLEAGNVVPADLRLLEEEELQVDESALTGESHAVEKQSAYLNAADLPIGDRLNLAWAVSRQVSYWQTVVFTVLTVSQLFHSLAVRSESASLIRLGLFSNLPMLGAVMLTLLLQMAVVYTPALNTIFHTQPLPMFELAVCLALSSLVLIAVEIEKWLMRRGFIYTNN